MLFIELTLKIFITLKINNTAYNTREKKDFTKIKSRRDFIKVKLKKDFIKVKLKRDFIKIKLRYIC